MNVSVPVVQINGIVQIKKIVQKTVPVTGRLYEVPCLEVVSAYLRLLGLSELPSTYNR